MRWLRRSPLVVALSAGGAVAFAATRLWAARPCLGPTGIGPHALLPMLLALCLPLGLCVLATSRWPRWLAGVLLVLAGSFAIVTDEGFAAATAATVAVALVAGARASRRPAVYALPAVLLAVLAVRYAVRASSRCHAMTETVAALPVLDARCALTASAELPPTAAASPLPPEVSVRCDDGRAELTTLPVLPVMPAFVRSWEYQRETGRWALRD